jgi:hypothetical protein
MPRSGVSGCGGAPSRRLCAVRDYGSMRPGGPSAAVAGKFMVDPMITGLALAALIGPENVPAEVFDAHALKAALN